VLLPMEIQFSETAFVIALKHSVFSDKSYTM
jgi:hypothetical protein